MTDKIAITAKQFTEVMTFVATLVVYSESGDEEGGLNFIKEVSNTDNPMLNDVIKAFVKSGVAEAEKAMRKYIIDWDSVRESFNIEDFFK